MLKLKNAVNSFIITKKIMNKKKKTRRMRGGMGMFRKTKTPEEVKLINENLIKEKMAKALISLIKALITAIKTDYDNCLLGIDKALKTKSEPNSIDILKKGRVHIPIVIENITKAKLKVENFKPNYPNAVKEFENLENYIQEKLKYLEINKNLIAQSGIDDVFPETIKDIYTEADIRPLSEVTKILILFDKVDTPELTVDLIDKTSKDANTAYKAFLEKVSKAESPSKGKGSSMFSFLSKPPVKTAQPAASVDIGPKTYTVTTSPECTTTQCVATATLQTGGSRKSKRSKKTLKGGRRRR